MIPRLLSVRPAFAASLSLVLLVSAVFVQTTGFEFLTVDDPTYVVDNPHVRAGLSWRGAGWALTASALGHWHPVTFLSYMLDADLYGLNPGGFHFTNVVLHAANALLVFALFQRMTGATWRSWFVAAVFAVHPLHVESVAWVAERKDVLSAFFGLLALHAYVSWTRQPSRTWYGAVCAAFALGVGSKAMVVTLPCAMLLLDYWPLRRFSPATIREIRPRIVRLIREKAPLFVIAGMASVMTVWASMRDNAVRPLEDLPLSYRLANAAVSYAAYVRKAVWPSDLSVFYPHLFDDLSETAVNRAVIVLAAFTVVALAFIRFRPYLIVGWLWFLGLIVPVSGFFQVGDQAMADRYTYLSLIGLTLWAAWGVPDLLGGGEKRRRTLAAATIVAVLALGAVAWRQTRLWRDTVTLYEHALAVAPDNAVARQVLGNAYLMRNDGAAAEPHLRRALEFHPEHPDWLNKLGYALFLQERRDEAKDLYERALAREPRLADAWNNLGLYYLEAGEYGRAAEHFREVARLRPGHEGPRLNVGIALALQKKYDEAMEEFEAALAIDPESVRAHYNMGALLVERGRYAEALPHLEFVLERRPDDLSAQEYREKALTARGESQK